MASRRYWLLLVLLLFLIAISPDASADSAESDQHRTDHKWFLSLYGGPHAHETLHDIFTLDATYSDGNYVAVGALAREVYRYKQWVSAEVEGQIGRHFGTDVHLWEFVGLMFGRWHPFPWDRYIDTSFAFGTGLSYYTDVSQIELERHEEAQQFLGYLAFELTFGLPQYPRGNFMLRIHHRSGANNTTGESGSNCLCAGLKFAF